MKMWFDFDRQQISGNAVKFTAIGNGLSSHKIFSFQNIYFSNCTICLYFGLKSFKNQPIEMGLKEKT